MQIIQPSLRDLCNAEFFPALKRRAIFEMSRWDKAMVILELELEPA
jgi:hypothetical protein